jgi:DNA-binding MarR family transcriptional regulator
MADPAPAADAPLASLPLDRMVCFALYSAAHAVQAIYKPALDALGLTYPQFLVLSALWQQDGRTVGQLGAALFLESNTLTPLLKRMETAGLIGRTRDARDERQVRITLTDRGRALQAQAATVPACLLDRSGLTREDLAVLNAGITGLRDRLRGGDDAGAEAAGSA